MIKHQAMLFSLRVTEPGKQILTAKGLYDFVATNIHGVVAVYVSSSEIQKHEEKLCVRFKCALDIDGIKSHHAIIPDVNLSQIYMKVMSTDSESTVRQVSSKEFKLEFEDVKGFVMFIYSSLELQLGCVTTSNQDLECFSVQKLEPTGQKNTFSFTDTIIEVLLDDIVCCVNPYFQSRGLVVKLYSAEVKAAQAKLNDMSKTT